MDMGTPITMTSDLQFRIGDRIRLARRSRRMSQGDLAAAVHCSRSLVGWWETGNGTPDLEQGVRLASALGVELDWLATGRSAGTGTDTAPYPPQPQLPGLDHYFAMAA